MKTAFIFSGLNSLLNESDRLKYTKVSTVRETFARASIVIEKKLGFTFNFSEYLTSNSSKLYDIDNVHLTATAVSAIQIGIVKQLEKKGLEADWLMSMSLGDIARCVVSFAIDFSQAMTFCAGVRYEQKKGLDKIGEYWALVSNKKRPFTQDIIDKFSANDLGVSWLSPNVIHISGTYQQLESITSLISSLRMRKIMLNQYPFHAPCLESYNIEAKSIIKKLNIHDPKTKIYSATLRRPLLSADDVSLEQQMTIVTPTSWYESIIKLVSEYGVKKFINIGPDVSLIRLSQDCLRAHDLKAEFIDAFKLL